MNIKKTKIICTIGPKTESKIMINKLIKNGMNIARLNMSHGNHEEHYNRIKNIRYVSNLLNKNIPIIIDTRGPEIRVNKFKSLKKIFLKKGQNFNLHSNDIIENNNGVSITYKNLFKEIKINSKIFLDDGLIKMNVEKIEDNIIICKVLNSAILEENKKINIENFEINLPYISKKDKEDLIFACKNNIEIIAISFVKNKNNILDIKKILHDNNGKNILIVSKIENKSSIEKIDEIIKESDGIMIARGDLGINIPIENIIIEQKKIIKKCILNYKPVITATHMLESMIKNLIPTRAEVGDISNAILDGTDCIMLSGETAKGKYPIECVNIMNKICIVTDKIINKKQNINNKYIINIINFNIINKLLVIITNNFNIIKKIIKMNNSLFIINITSNKSLINKLLIFRGIFSYFLKDITFNKNIYKIINNFITKNKLLKNKDKYFIFYSKCNKNLDRFLIKYFKE